MSETPLVWFVEARQRWIAVCPLRRCGWYVGGVAQAEVEHTADLHAAVCSGRQR